MNYTDRTLAGLLKAKLTDLTNQHGAELLAGAAADFADYRARTGYIQALRDVEAIVQQTIHELTGRK